MMVEMVEIVKDRFLSAIVCSDIDPESENAFDRVDIELRGIYNGTMNGWRTRREGDNLHGQSWDAVKPGPCKDIPGRWHYVVIT